MVMAVTMPVIIVAVVAYFLDNGRLDGVDYSLARFNRRPIPEVTCFQVCELVLPYSGAGASRSILMVRSVRSAYLG
jgi:hypothetical protein